MIDVSGPALVLTETTLKGMSGVELLQKIKRNPRTFSIPVMVLTTSRDPAVKEACLRDGCAAFLQKPVDPDVLYAAVQKATESVPRKYIRLNTCLNVIIGEEKAGAAVIDDYITALSEQGMYVSTQKPRPVGLQVPVTIFLQDRKISAEGMVLYSFQRGEGPLKTPGMGIKFSRISDEDQAVIRVFIKQEITKGLTDAHLGGTIF
jgi:DNA-binding response OmpR family regulator